MKKLLLGTTALVLLSGAAAAQQVTTKSPFTVKINGSIRYDFALFDQDVTNINRESRIDTRITLTAEATADNGLTYGYLARIRPGNAGAGSQALGLDYSYIYGSGTWGQVMLGDHGGAATQLEVITPTVGIGQADLAPFLSAGNASIYWATEDLPITRVTYLTPSFSGFQAGVSYAPEQDTDRAISYGVGLGGSSTNYSDIVEVAASYTGEFSGVGVRVGGGYEFAAERNGAGDYQIYNVGAVVSYAGFSAGGNFYSNGETGLANGDDQFGWAVGLTYEIGPWGVGASYNQVHTDILGSTADGIDRVFGIGGAYALAPGLSLQADVNAVDAESVANDGYQLVFRTRVDF